MTSRQPSIEHSLNIRKPYFDLIASGDKTFEVRVDYPKIRRIGAGDTLRITCADESLSKRVTAIKECPSFAALLDDEDVSANDGHDMPTTSSSPRSGTSTRPRPPSPRGTSLLTRELFRGPCRAPRCRNW
ncbi:ASCH domain-containing protein [Streptomyces sp. NPDC096068]|uniref:ASCH domain-containing protein n=1 Tax=Streptomyces sp. NPDC096068 TaxID=3155424 RepID=UPI00332DA5DA